MHFCFVLPQWEHYSPVSGGAVATVTAHVTGALQLMGHRVDVIAPLCADPVYEAGLVHFVGGRKAHVLAEATAHLVARLRGWESPYEGFFYRTVFAKLKRLQPDVVVLANDLVRIRALRSVLPSVRIGCWIHNECRSPKITSEGLGEVAAFLCCSDYIKKWLTCRYLLDEKRVHTVYAGVDKELFYPRVNAPLGEPLRVLFTGRLDQNKGVDVAVKSVARLAQKGVPIQLTVAGNAWFYPRKGTETDPFQSDLREAMKASGTDWLGHVPRRFLPDVMRRHDVALVLSRSQEPYGLVVLESMASGLAVIASARGGLGEACDGAALLVDPEDNVRVESVLERLSSNRDELMMWKSRGLERVRKAHWNDTAKALCSAIGCDHSQASSLDTGGNLWRKAECHIP